MNMPLVLLNRRRRGFTAFSPSALFALAEPGVWYDPSDLTTLFTDTAGTTFVTTPGQTVALMLDKSKGLTLGSELVTNTGGPFVTTDGWTAQVDATLSINSGSLRVTNNAAATKRAYFAFTSVVGKSYVFVATVTGSGGGVVGGRLTAGTSLANESLGTTASAASGPLRLQFVATGTTTFIQLVNQGTSLGGYAEWASASLKELAGNHATQATAASRPTYQSSGGRHWLAFDGADDFMVTPTITPGVDKVQVFAGVRKLSDAARGTIVEHSATIASNNGSFHLTAPNAASATFGFESKGTTLTDAVATFAAPTTRVVTGIGDIAGDSTIIRANGTQQDQDTADQGTGNYLAYPIYIGRRGGTTLPFNGQIYSMIVRFGANLDAGTITPTETFVNGKTGAF
jgi:hypothetical protein